jgi:hypothetical protein
MRRMAARWRGFDSFDLAGLVREAEQKAASVAFRHIGVKKRRLEEENAALLAAHEKELRSHVLIRAEARIRTG